MNYLKNTMIICFIFLISLPSISWSQALPKNINRAVSGSMQQNMIRRGFAANDPRYNNTLVRVSPALSSIAGGAAAVAVGTITAPAWLTVLGAIVVGTAVSYAVTLALDSLADWLFRPDGKIDITDHSVANYKQLIAGQPAWKANRFITTSTWDVAWGGDGLALAFEADASYRKAAGQTPRVADPSNCSFHTDANNRYVERIECGAVGTAILYLSGNNYSCPQGQFWVAGVCTIYGFTAANGSTQTGATPQQAISSLSNAELNKPLNPNVIAKIANESWKKAAALPDYDGVPYKMTDPVTTQDAKDWIDKNKNYEPKVGDLVAPNPVTSPQPNPWVLPLNPSDAVTNPATTPNQGTVNPSTQPLINLGPDPAIGAPTLETTPTAQAILEPILNLMPDLKNYSPSMTSGICPKPTLNLFEKTFILDSHCALFDEHKSEISSVMILIYALLALFIILSA